MASLPRKISFDIEMSITEKTAHRMCDLLSDYLNDNWDKEIEVIMIQADDEIRREVRLVEKG